MRGASAEHDALDGRAAGAAGLGFTAVDAVEFLEAARCSISIAIVAQGAAAMAEGTAERAFDGSVQAGDLVSSQGVGGGERVNARAEQRLVHIDVPKPGNHGLIQEGVFDRAGGARQSPGKLRWARLHGFRPHVALGRQIAAEPPDAAEAARVNKSQLGLEAREFNYQMRVRRGRILGFVQSEAAGHAQVDIESIVVVEREDDSLPPASDLQNRAAREQGRKIDPRGREDVLALELNAHDLPPQQLGPEGIDDSLDFRKFGQSATFARAGTICMQYGITPPRVIRGGLGLRRPPLHRQPPTAL